MRHAWLARALITACGGPSAAADVCRLAKSRLSEIQDPNAPTDAFMPADVIADLEAYCGRPIYSTALAEETPASPAADVVTEACELSEAALAAQRLVRLTGCRAFKRGEIDEALADLNTVEEHARAMRKLLGLGRP